MNETEDIDAFESFSGDKGLKFTVDNGKTYYLESSREKVLLGDFSLKLQGQLLATEEEKYGFWVASCTSTTRGKLETKTIVLPANSFDSKAKFLNELRSRFGSGILNLGGGVTSSILADYYSFLKEDLIRPRQLFKANHLGFQRDGYWLLSRELHISNKELVGPREHCYFLTESELFHFATVMGPHLLSEHVMKTVCKRFIQLSEHFATNQIPFLLGTAFVLYSNVKAILKSDGKNFSDESSIGILYSKDRNVGKTLSLRLLALGQGIESQAHPLLCSGGDQNISGVSVKVLMATLAATTLTCLVDDPVLTTQLNEFLLQVQSGLPQGSLRTGYLVPSGSILMSSNSREGERIYGRSMLFDYKSDNSFKISNDYALKSQMLDLFEKNKGFLIAWVILFLEDWKDGNEKTIKTFKEILGETVPKQQQRWRNGVAALLYTFSVFYEVATDGPVPLKYLECCLLQMIESGNKAPQDGDSFMGPSFWERLTMEIRQALATSRAPLTWLNPCVNVSSGGRFVPAIGITSHAVAAFTSIGNKEAKENITSKIDSLNATTTMLFAVNDIANIEDLRKKKQGMTKTAKGYKIPRQLLEEAILKEIDYACGLTKDKPSIQDAGSEAPSQMEVKARDGAKKMEKVLSSRKTTPCIDRDNEKESPLRQPSSIEEISPISRLKYDLMSPGKKDSFSKGVMAGMRLAKKQSLISPTSTSTPHNVQETQVTLLSKRRLFPEGAIGVNPVPIKNSRACNSGSHDSGRMDDDEDQQDGEDDDNAHCGLCNLSTPPSKKGKTAMKIEWIQCDDCEAWYHMYCMKLKVAPKKFSCNKCQ